MTADGNFDDFKERRDLWTNRLASNDRNSIMHQINSMIWDAASFSVINEARRIAPPAEEGGVQLNGLVHGLINRCFFHSQMLAIRRLTDPGRIEGHPRNHDVFSLTSLLEDMREHANLMTRGNFFAVEELEYDVSRVQEEIDRKVSYQVERGKTAGPLRETPPNLPHLQRRHEQIDALAGVSPATRSPNDAVRPEALLYLKMKVLEACKDVRTHVDKFIAHAATPNSRQVINADNVAVTLNHLWQAHETICKAANFVSVNILAGSGTYGVLDVLDSCGKFKHIDKPLVSTEQIHSLAKAWEAYQRETCKWAEWAIGDSGRELAKGEG